MRIAYVGHGGLPIPAPGWGAVEGVIWRRAQRLRSLGHTVDIYNSKDIDAVIEGLNKQTYDFVNCHNDGFAADLNAGLKHPYVLTNHRGDLHRLATQPDVGQSYVERLEGCRGAPGTIALSPLVRDYLRHGYAGFLRVLPNTVEVDDFRYASRGRRGAICLGKILARKRQAKLADVTRSSVRVDFVGGWNRSRVPEFTENETARYLGPWDR